MTPDRVSDLAFRRPGGRRSARRDDDAWESLVRSELVKLRSRTPSGPRVVPAGRRDADAFLEEDAAPPAAA
jgi:hypothetical protein